MTSSFVALIVFGILFAIAIAGLMSASSAAARHHQSNRSGGLHPDRPQGDQFRKDQRFGSSDLT